MIQLSKYSLVQDRTREGPKDPHKKVTVCCAEGNITVSTWGRTSLYTGGFMECLGMMIAGLVASSMLKGVPRAVQAGWAAKPAAIRTRRNNEWPSDGESVWT
jgi:hypothetical protein